MNGNLPDAFDSFHDMTILDLHKNEFTGGIPPSIGQMTNLGTYSLLVKRAGFLMAVNYSSLPCLPSVLNFSQNISFWIITNCLEMFLSISPIWES